MGLFKTKTASADRVRDLNCSFCSKSKDQIAKLIAGPTVYICNECIDICNDVLSHDSQVKPPWRELPEPPAAIEEKPRLSVFLL